MSGLGELVLIDTSSLRPWLGRRNGMYSRYNAIHAQMVDVLSGLVPPGASVGAISPFAPQASLLRSLIEDPDNRRAAATVHRFQGGERDVIVWDVTEGRAGGTRHHPWFSEMTARPGEGARLINVAISRAKDQLIAVADVERMRTLEPTSIVRTTLAAVERRGVVIDAIELLRAHEGRTTLSVGSDPIHPLDVLLESVKRSLVIWSSAPPAVADDKTFELLRNAVRDGISVHIRTGAPTTRQRGALEDLQRLGCNVQLVRPCWENVAYVEAAAITSSGSLLDVRPSQQWIHTRDADFASGLGRLLRRKGDADTSAGQRDPTCSAGHPLLVEVVNQEVYRYRCLWCHGEHTGAAVRTGRSRGNSSAAAGVCPSCFLTLPANGVCGNCA